MRSAAVVLPAQDRGAWVIAQQLTARGATSLKFYLAALAFGPEAFGLLTVALIVVAVTDAMTDTGIAAALVQDPAEPSARALTAALVAIVARGLFLATLLALFAMTFAKLFGSPDSSDLIFAAAAIPLVKSLVSPGQFLAQRDRRFRSLFVVDLFHAITDILTFLLLVRIGYGVVAAIAATCLAESVRAAASWLVNPAKIDARLERRDFVVYARFAGWVWVANVATTLLNNFDRWLVSRALGPAELAAYQLAHKVAHLFVADPAAALHGYVYPTFAKHARSSMTEAHGVFSFWRRRVALAGIAMAAVVGLCSDPVLIWLLGDKWATAAQLCTWMVVPVWISALLSMYVPFAKAIGRPDLVVRALVPQAAVLLTVAPLLVERFGAIGMIVSVAASFTVALMVLHISVRTNLRT